MLNGQYSGDSTLYYSVADPAGGEARSSTAGGFEAFLDMFGARHSSGDLFDLVWRGGAREEEVMSSPPLPPAVVLPPSSEVDDMVAWLINPTVSGGQEPAVVAGHDDQTRHHVATAADHKREMRPPKVEERCGAVDLTKSGTSWKKATGGASRSHHAETHNLTEKRRRCKINEKLKTLRQLVPGCDKSNQASILDQTIHYIKSLQLQIQVQSLPAAYPVVASPYLPPPGTGVAAGGELLPPAAFAPARGHVIRPGVVLEPAPPPAMVPFGPLLVHHPPSCCCGHGAPGSGCSRCYMGSRSQGARQNNSVSGNNGYAYT